ncbi:hypothetical protein BATDEDRAFT_24299 [Batrachochytrium dendrobatidis JAM81]|uniref:Uncharacterized protein n=1 Tax=Batrachochytrium dendrobatidis (strain JAM81 / FGSC 10211) TaxID=684364 RepID=F4P2F0_BATDJ|nr:uncharacterized protein BATDEDRAFT_24299 [Batrachochytrium dendrobatidis JAM81]EGF80846.1 hypothetical protein BATDEDRAFT_24299 [Batrachochytrium dendrobatidis JAM81]|eukprot:XP_006678400.1 hypothetical protein BATDEDRAFT_24299 [Batrachochytrium dendrobatidis JAM81]
MPKRYLDVEYNTISTEIDVTDFEDLSDVQDTIKSEYGPAMADIDAPQLQLYTNNGFCVVIGCLPLPPRQPTQTDLGPTSAAASPALLDFWTAFTNYPNPLEGNTVVQLPADVFILGNHSIGSSIYIRPCYPKLFEKSLSIVQSADIRHLIILGNPGIGKTYFSYFLLLHLARSGATVVYESGVDQKRYLLTPNVPQELVESLYLKWGGIARYVLKYALVKEKQDFLDKALNISNIDSVVKSFGKYGENLDASSCLIHISVKDGFHSGPYQFAPDYVVDEIYNQIGETGQLNRVLFEKHAHTVIAKGGSFKIRDLRTKLESTLQLPMDLSTLLFSNNSQVQDATNCYFRPISNTFESVDSFIKPNLLFQMTGAKDHPCKQTELCDVLEILGNPSKPELYFVVPPDRFACFTRQSYHGTDGRVLSQNDTIASVEKLTRFVLTFEPSHQ